MLNYICYFIRRILFIIIASLCTIVWFSMNLAANGGIANDIKKCYLWNPPLWNYIIKNHSQEKVVNDIMTMCNPRTSGSLKKTWHLYNNQQKLNDYYNIIYNLMLYQTKQNNS